jgi:hypothetical protein
MLATLAIYDVNSPAKKSGNKVFVFVPATAPAPRNARVKGLRPALRAPLHFLHVRSSPPLRSVSLPACLLCKPARSFYYERASTRLRGWLRQVRTAPAHAPPCKLSLRFAKDWLAEAKVAISAPVPARLWGNRPPPLPPSFSARPPRGAGDTTPQLACRLASSP